MTEVSNEASTPSYADPGHPLGKCLQCGSLLNVPIRIHISYFFVVVLVVLASIPYLSFKYLIYQLILYGPILFLTILIHEFGHVLTAKHLGGEPIGIILWPLGGLGISSPPNPPSHRSNMLVAAAGPATHLLGLVWLGLANLTALGTSNPYNCTINIYYVLHGNAADWFAHLFLGAFYMNVVLLIFNLLVPAYPLDGGQILASTLLMKGVPPEKAGRTTAAVAFGIGVILLLVGLITLFVGQNPFSVMNVLAAAFIMWSSWELYKLVAAGRVKEHPLFGTCSDNDASSATDLPAPGVTKAVPDLEDLDLDDV